MTVTKHPVRYAKYWRVDIEHKDEDGFVGATTYLHRTSADAIGAALVMRAALEEASRSANEDVQKIVVTIERPRLS